MTSMYDEPGTQTTWPGAERRRQLQTGSATVGASRAAEGIDPVLTPAPAGVATAYNTAELDAADAALVTAMCERAGVDPAALGRRVHVARTRRGMILMLTVYTLDAAGQPVHVLGIPDVRHVIRPVTADELPAAWLQGGDR